MIYFLRHGDAEDGDGDDASRRLTAKGERQARAAGAALAALGVDIDTCLTSPKVRATQTAGIASEPLGIDVEICEALGGGPFDANELTAARGAVLLVGHEPDFSNEVARMTGARVKLKKGGLAAVDGAVLKALLRPADLLAISL